MNASSPEITIVIPNWNGRRWLPDCLDALSHQTFGNFAVVVVDNGSTDDSCGWLREQHPDVKVIALDQNTGFAHAVNVGIHSCDSPFIALLNTDTRAEPSWLEKLYQALNSADDRVGAVCGKMLKRDQPDTIENAGDLLSWQGAAEKRGNNQSAAAFSEPGEIFSCCAGAALYRRTFFDRVGLFDDSYFAYLEDIDLGLRGRLMGFEYRYIPEALVEHEGHGSAMPSARYVRLTTANRLRLFIKHIPGRLLLRKLPSILYGQWYFLACQRRPVATLLGWFDAMRALPDLVEQRKTIRRSTVLHQHDIRRLLNDRMQQPGLLQAFSQRLRNRNHGAASVT